MALEVRQEPSSSLITVRVSGRLSRVDYQQFAPVMERVIERVGKVRILFIMENFHGWDLGAIWEDIKFDLRHFSDIERVAMVGEARWQQWMAAFCRPFTTAKIRYFDSSEQPSAVSWLQ